MAHERPLLDVSPRPPLPPPLAEPPLRLDPSARSDRISFVADTAVPRRGSRADSDRLANSLKDLSDDDARLVFINDPDKTNERFEFAGNSIRTSKYSLLTFLPRNIFEQFHRVAYVYFLVIAVLNQLPQLAVFGRGASILPLAFVLLVTAVKDAYEDWRRHRSDRIENSRTAFVLSSAAGDGRQFQPKRWKDIRISEII